MMTNKIIKRTIEGQVVPDGRTTRGRRSSLLPSQAEVQAYQDRDNQINQYALVQNEIYATNYAHQQEQQQKVNDDYAAEREISERQETVRMVIGFILLGVVLCSGLCFSIYLIG